MREDDNEMDIINLARHNKVIKISSFIKESNNFRPFWV